MKIYIFGGRGNSAFNQSFTKSFQLINGLIFCPRKELIRIKEGGIGRNVVYSIFVVTILITLAKAIFRPWDKSFNLFPTQYLNEIIILLNNPFVLWAREYLLYFCILYLLARLCRLFNKGEECYKLPLVLIGISGIGIIAQVLFLPLNYLLNKNLLRILGVAFYVWNCFLIFFAVRIASSLPYVKVLIIILIPLVILALSPLGIWSFMSPYLLFLF